MKFLTVEEVIDIHSSVIKMSGGLDGIRDMGLLISAIEMPKSMMFGEYLHESFYDKAAAYLYHIACNHAFLDGNKRTGAISTLVFLDLNDMYQEINESEYEELVCGVAKGIIKKKDISDYFRFRTLGVIESIKEGLIQAEQGKIFYRGSFSKYAKDEG